MTMGFEIFKHSAHQSSPRLGRLICRVKQVVETPNFLGVASRGIVPHVSQDNAATLTDLKGLYIAIEDFVEKVPTKAPPIFSEEFTKSGLDLRKFTAQPERQLVVLGPRRAPPVLTPNSNTVERLSISTSVGFRNLPIHDYINACSILKPDIAIGIGDIPYGPKPGTRRIEKLSSHTERWMTATVEARIQSATAEAQKPLPELFAPIIPIPQEQQSIYLEVLSQDLRAHVSGLAIYDAELAVDLPSSLGMLPRLCLAEPPNPQAVLHQVALGMDLQTIPFVGAATDAGVALCFHFPSGEDTSQKIESRQVLGFDMLEAVHETDLGPLVQGCDCAVCKKHHRAYIRHLLSAKEMLAWVLLQIHNLRVVEVFFQGIRESLRDDSFEARFEQFNKTYKETFPEKTGQGPRVRGYQFKSDGGDAKKNAVLYRKLGKPSEEGTENESSSTL